MGEAEAEVQKVAVQSGRGLNHGSLAGDGEGGAHGNGHARKGAAAVGAGPPLVAALRRGTREGGVQPVRTALGGIEVGLSGDQDVREEVVEGSAHIKEEIERVRAEIVKLQRAGKLDKVAEPIMAKALANIQAELRRRMGSLTIALIEKSFDVQRMGDRLVISVIVKEPKA